MKSLTILLCTLAATALSQTTTRPFQVMVATPELPMLLPIYLTADGTTSSTPSDAAAVRIVEGELFVGGSDVPVGAGTGAWETLLRPLQGLDSINTEWDIVDNTLRWVNGRFPYGEARFVWGTGGDEVQEGAVYALLGPAPYGEDDGDLSTTPANLLVHVPPNW